MPSYASSSSNPAALTANQDRLVLDNLIRRELKVGDPSDPQQVAQALLERYRGDPRAQAITQESRGLPFLQAVAPVATVPAQSAACGAEWQQALDDIESDLRSLTADAILKDVKPELHGWAQAIRTALAEGYNAARFALDPRNRDKGLAMRRQLNDYARLARLVGAHTPALVANFRKFAQSLDEAANLLLVIMGEALANVGFGGGRYLPQVAYSELQTRRDAAIYALRNLVGSTQMAYGPEDWPRGLDAYRQLTELLEAQGQNDLRSLLVETELARTMDELVQRSGDSTADGLRAVGSTALLALERFRRMVKVARRGISPESPALYAYLEALQLFASAFDSAGGFRLMKIARPPILFYGLYGNTGMDDADRRLIDLITRRGILAETLDCLAGSCCLTNRSCLVLLDKVLYDLDRAIDLYALGFSDFGATERRASAYGFVIDAVIGADRPCGTLDQPVVEGLQTLADTVLRPQIDIARDEGMRVAVRRIRGLAQDILDALAAASLPDDEGVGDRLAALPAGTTGKAGIVALTRLYAAIVRSAAALQDAGVVVEGDAEVGAYVGVVEQELCLQREMETRWSNLVHSMVANCGTIDVSLGQLREVVDAATEAVAGEACREEAPIDLPPALETSLDTLVDSVERTGLGRPNRVAALQKRR
ncbi:hypothetical protein GPA22_05715 [Aromatoleum toluvorans]|uniref:Uncharacterized protein n=1 Tax=Aromatoleum toluvorans TaxID=92002 RepID=A0ABX1PV43_9RHOO|nr:hypothetical protein [Aromatoleum toluvorans]NMG43228.1 hypothetical protein [Aromatoleum toluvorans]